MCGKYFAAFTYMINQQLYIFKYAQLHVILHQYISVTFPTFIRVSYNKNTINTQ